MKQVCVIGAGQLGSRHLQALKALNEPLAITVVDPNQQSLQVAAERYQAVAGGNGGHTVAYLNTIPQFSSPVDLAIVASSANARRGIIENLLATNQVRNMVLEKLLFPKAEDYQAVSELFARSGANAWVNCSMRTMPFYRRVSEELGGRPVYYQVSGSQYGLVTNAIHYLDHIVSITGCPDFTLETALLDQTTIASKRPGFIELNGTLNAFFADGSQGTFICYADGDAPVQVEISSRDARYIVKETQRRAWVARARDGWQWQEIDAIIPYQSEMTATVAEQILAGAGCPLVSFSESVKTHLQLLGPLQQFLNRLAGQKYDHYPFT